MAEEDSAPAHSPLTQSVTRDGKTVQVEIYEDGEGRWLLEVVDEYWNSSVWNDPFATDQEALDEALRTIDEEGIDSLIGAPPGRQRSTGTGQPAALDLALSEDELDELDDFLADEAIQDTSMDVSTLDGFLSAIAIGPRLVSPSEWLPWIWDMNEGRAAPEFDGKDEANRIMSHVMRHYNSVVRAFTTDPASFEPIFRQGRRWGAAEWSEGFMIGFMFAEDAWNSLSIEQPIWFTPFVRLGTDEGIEITKKEGDAEKWMNEIEPSLLKIHAYWKDKQGPRGTGLSAHDFLVGRQRGSTPIVRAGLKTGRNDPCACGSGKKYKKCCGDNGAPRSDTPGVQQVDPDRVRCEGCGEIVPGFDIASCGSIDEGYRELCSRCYNAAAAKISGVEGFENVRLEPVVIADCSGKEHQFHFRTYLLGSHVSLEAFELTDGHPAGYWFRIAGDPEGDSFALLGQMIQKIRRALSVKHVEDGELGLRIVDQTVKGKIGWDESQDGRTPLMSVDGREISWEDFGRMLMTFEGWQFKLEIFDPSDEV